MGCQDKGIKWAHCLCEAASLECVNMLLYFVVFSVLQSRHLESEEYAKVNTHSSSGIMSPIDTGVLTI